MSEATRAARYADDAEQGHLHVVETGSGARPIVALHGWSGTHETFVPLAPYLADSARLLAFDLPGCGHSAPPRSWDLNLIADAVAAEARRRAVGPIEIVGSCSGAIIALVIAERHPALVSRLVLVDPFAYVPWYFAVFLHPRIGRRAYMTTFANPLGRWLTNRSLAARRTRESDLTASFRRIDHESTLRYLQLLAAVGDARRFAGIGIPIDIVHGARTFGAVRKSVSMWRAQWRQAKVHEVAGSGHLPIEEAPEAVARIIG